MNKRPNGIRIGWMARIKRCVWLFSFPLLCLGVSNIGLAADVFYIQARLGAAGDLCGNPPYQEAAGSWSNSGSRSSLDPFAGLGSRFGYSATCQLVLTPTNCVPGGVYQIDTTHISVNASADLVVSVTYQNCTGDVTSSDAFQYKYMSPTVTWQRICRFTNNSSGLLPSITFTYLSGNIASSGGRWYSDAYRFTDCTDPCVDALPQLSTVTGPLVEGQTYVDVPGVTNTATGVRVYADNVEIGYLEITGTPQSTYRVDTLPLVKGQRITTTQHDITLVESCRPQGGQVVGGGANPKIRVCLNIRQNAALAGPIGADGGSAAAPLKFLGATNALGGSGTPMGTWLFSPSKCWQTVHFMRGDDPVWCWLAPDAPYTNTLLGDFGVLESIAFVIDDLQDTGPFRIYIDNIMNGTTVLQDFESAADGETGVMFRHPGYSGTTSPFLLGAPNICQVSSENADASQQSALISFQFRDGDPASWVRLTTYQATTMPNPMVDLRQPITFRMLLLPVGETTGLPDMTVTPLESQSAAAGSDVTLSVTVTGPEPFTFIWRKNGEVLPEYTTSSVLLGNVTAADAGEYSVQVTGGCGSAYRYGYLSIVEAPRMQNLIYDTQMGMFTFSFQTLNGVNYVLEYKDDLNAPVWTYATTLAGDGSIIPISSNVAPGNRFYRLRTE